MGVKCPVRYIYMVSGAFCLGCYCLTSIPLNDTFCVPETGKLILLQANLLTYKMLKQERDIQYMSKNVAL